MFFRLDAKFYLFTMTSPDSEARLPPDLIPG